MPDAMAPDVTTPIAPVSTPERIQGAVHDPRRHESAHKHVSGEAVYVDDIAEPAGLRLRQGEVEHRSEQLCLHDVVEVALDAATGLVLRLDDAPA